MKMNKEHKCIIISCFAGIGKNYAIKYLTNIIQDIKYIVQKKKGDFYINICTSSQDYINYINTISKSVDILFIPYFLNMEKRFIQGKVDYYLIYPSINCKNEYIKRFKELDFTKEQIKYLSNNWDNMIFDCENCNISNNKKIKLSKNTYLLDMLLRLLHNLY